MTYEWIVITIVGAVLTGFVSFLYWLLKRSISKAENNIETAMKTANNALSIANSAVDETRVQVLMREEAATRKAEIETLRQDMRELSNKVVSATENLEKKIENLLYHLLNNGDKK